MNCVAEGIEIRKMAKELVLKFMRNTEKCAPCAEGMSQAEIFRACGLDWGQYPHATSSNQQYWIVALLRELECEGKVERDTESKKWRIQ